MVHTYLAETINFHITYKKKKSVRFWWILTGMLRCKLSKRTPVEYLVQPRRRSGIGFRQHVRKWRSERVDHSGKGFMIKEKAFVFRKYVSDTNFQDTNITQDNAVFEGDKLHIYVKDLKDEKIQQALKRFYYKQCKSLVEKSIKAHQSNFKTKPRSIRITDSSRTWGTCDSIYN